MPADTDIISQLRGRLDLVIILMFCGFIGFGFGLVLHKIDTKADQANERLDRLHRELNVMSHDAIIMDAYRSTVDGNDE